MAKKVTAYCRVSTDKEEQENSLNNQISYFEREIANIGYEYIPLYFDEGITGTNARKRTGLNRMLADAGVELVTYKSQSNKKISMYEVTDKQPLFQEIWVKNTSRLGRNVHDMIEIIECLTKKEINVHFVEQNLDTLGAHNLIILKVMQIFDEQESKDKSSKVMWGYLEKSKQGKLITNSRLFGYNYLPKPEERLVINEEEAKIVRKIYELYSNGYGFRRLCEYLDKHDMKTRNGNSFAKNAVSRILSNEKYYGGNNSMKYDAGVIFDKHYAKVKDKYEIKDTTDIEPIISKKLFYKCKEIRENKVNYKTQKGVNKGYGKYTGLLYCGKCGKSYIRNVDKGRAFFNCSTKKTKGTKTCNAQNINENELDVYFEWLKDKGLKRYIQTKVNRYMVDIVIRIDILLRSIDNQSSIDAENLNIEIENEKVKLTKYYELSASDTADKSILDNLIKQQENLLIAMSDKYSKMIESNDDIIENIRNLVIHWNETSKLYNSTYLDKQVNLTNEDIERYVDKIEVLKADGDIIDNSILSFYGEYKTKNNCLLKLNCKFLDDITVDEQFLDMQAEETKQTKLDIFKKAKENSIKSIAELFNGEIVLDIVP